MVKKFLLNSFVFQSQSGMNAQAVQEQEVTLLQSVFRAHLKRSTLTIDRWYTIDSVYTKFPHRYTHWLDNWFQYLFIFYSQKINLAQVFVLVRECKHVCLLITVCWLEHCRASAVTQSASSIHQKKAVSLHSSTAARGCSQAVLTNRTQTSGW